MRARTTNQPDIDGRARGQPIYIDDEPLPAETHDSIPKSLLTIPPSLWIFHFDQRLYTHVFSCLAKRIIVAPQSSSRLSPSPSLSIGPDADHPGSLRYHYTTFPCPFSDCYQSHNSELSHGTFSDDIEEPR